MNAFEPIEVARASGLVVRFMKASFYLMLGCLVTWRTWNYTRTSGDPYPMIPIVLCVCLVAVLYTLSIVTLAGRSQLLATGRVDDGERDDSMPARAGDRVTA